MTMRSQYLIELPDLDVMALTVRAEAGGESELGQKAIAWVIRNRFEDTNPKHSWWKKDRNDGIPDNTIKAVCLDPWQFSCWNENDPTYKRNINPSTLLLPQVQRIKQICKDVLESKTLDDDPTNGANHYCTNAVAQQTEWARNKKPLVIIGNHRFFRL